MKTFVKTIKNKSFQLTMLFFLAGLVLTFNSCDREDDYGTPSITNVRLTDPEKADSSIYAADMGSVIVIQGNNLASATNIFFNDVEAFVNPTYVTDNVIIVTIPSEFPAEINNRIRLVTKGGETTYDFTVNVPNPVISGFKSEYVEDGDELVIYGQYFVNVTVVAFEGGVDGTIVSESENELVVKVPDEAQTGKVTVETVAGSGESPYPFRDTTGVMLDFDNTVPCWGGMVLVDATTNPDPAPVSGNYVRVTDTEIPEESWWNNNWVVAICGSMGVTSGVPASYIIKFEINVLEDWEYGWFEMKIVSGNEYFYRFMPYQDEEGGVYKSDGWVTLSAPVEEFRIKVGGNPTGEPISDILNGADFYIAFQNGAGGVVPILDVCFDNIRIVKKVTTGK